MTIFGLNGEDDSIVAKAVFGLSNRHTVCEATDLPVDTRDGHCELQTSSEEHWVAHFAHLALLHCRAKLSALDFQSFVEIPSKHREKHDSAGHDLSLGPLKSPRRIRTMHKTVAKTWCDRPWVRRFKPGDLAHLSRLFSKGHYFYIVLHVFYCNHDWRNMGAAAKPDSVNLLNSSVSVPPFESTLRTLVFDLWSAELGSSLDIETFEIKHSVNPVVEHAHAKHLASIEAESAFSIWVNGAEVKANGSVLRPIGFRGFLAKLDEYWDQEWANFAPAYDLKSRNG